MNYINVGKIITTHGLKGEMKITSNFSFKDKVFKPGFILYLGNNFEEHRIISYRKHQNYDMVILDKIDDIDKAIKYKQQDVYILKADLDLEGIYLDTDLIGMDVYFNDSKIGNVKDIVDAGSNNILIVLDNAKYIPKNDNFIENVDLKNKKLYLKNVEGLIWELIY